MVNGPVNEPVSDADHQALRESLGAYLLGGLSAAEAAQLEQHLVTCAECAADHAQLAPVAEALADVRSGDVGRAARSGTDGPDLTVPVGLGSAVEAAVTAQSRRTSRRSWARSAAVAGVAAASAAAVLVVGLRVTAPDQPQIPLEHVAIAQEAAGIEASADLVAHTWGVEVKLHATGFEAGRRYVVSVLGGGGQTFAAGEFVGTGPAEMTCNLNSSVLRDRAAGFEVRDDRGDVVLLSRF